MFILLSYNQKSLSHKNTISILLKFHPHYFKNYYYKTLNVLVRIAYEF